MIAAAEPVRTPVAQAPRAARTLRLAVFSYGLPCQGQKRGGVEQVTHDLANALVDRGHRVTIFTYDPAPATARYEVAALPFKAFVHSWLGRRMTMGYLGNLIAIWPDYSAYDAIIAHGDSLLLPLKGTPVVRVMHGSASEEARSATSLGRRVLQWGVYLQELATAATCRGTVGVSENTRASNRYVRQIIPNGVDLSLFAPDQAAQSPTPSILFVGALGGRKRGAWLIDRFVSEIRPACERAELHMVTTPGASAPGVHYHTGISAPDLVQLYQRAWVYASPSTYEGFGLPYLEAMACGAPVVATPNPGSREVLADGRFGRLVDDSVFASTVIELLGSPDQRRRLSGLGVERARAFDIRTSAARYETLILDLMGHHD
ncbi:MAG: glycosyltransferase family 4 protein [Vicinamibacterales bacterium]